MDLSKQQRAAVEHMGPALVVAGAGSGKTRALTAKIAYLIQQGFAPERILAITFTNKAADEMKSRLSELTGCSMDLFPWVRTFHSACLRILKAHCRLLGFENPLQVLGDYQQQKIVQDILGRLNIDKKNANMVRSSISFAKNSGNPGRYFERSPFVANVRLADIYSEYEKELKNCNAVDFDNLLLLTRDLLRDHQEVRKQYQRLFTYILVDEYQDTNDLQEEITRLLLGSGNIFCVGDDWQAIYGFRGSNIRNFLSFSRNYSDSRVFRLECNYRSAGEIVETANRLIANNASRMEKECYSVKNGGTVEINDFFSDDEEASWVADRIRALNTEQGVRLDEIAVLYRTRFCSLAFERAFRASGIAYRMLGGKGFYDRKEILDINCYLTAAVFEKDEAAFLRVINTPKRGIGPKMIGRIREMRQPGTGLKEAARLAVEKKSLPAGPCSRLSGLLCLLDKLSRLSPGAAIQRILEDADYLDHLRHYAKTSEDYAERVENIEQLVYAASQHKSLIEYLEEAALIKEDKEEEEHSAGGVKMGTMHASKGLEFRAVFVAGCEESLLPHWKSTERGSDIEEERRLMYVAMTRAEEFLFLSSASFRKGQFNPRSRFLVEIEEAAA